MEEEDTSFEAEETSVEEDTSVAEKMAEKLAAEMLKEYRMNNWIHPNIECTREKK